MFRRKHIRDIPFPSPLAQPSDNQRSIWRELDDSQEHNVLVLPVDNARKIGSLSVADSVLLHRAIQDDPRIALADELAEDVAGLH